MRYALVFVAMLLVCRCASIRDSEAHPTPTPQRPMHFCAISCAQGFLFRAQHLCRGGSRFFEDFDAIGEFVKRNDADGTVESSVWIACAEWSSRIRGECARTLDYQKADVVCRPCSEAIRDIVQSRDVSQRGVHPGETPSGAPDHK